MSTLEADFPNHPIIKPKILIVDDRPENLIALNATLENIDAEIIAANSGLEALQHLLNHDFALALLDVQMPEMDGYELADIMKESVSTATIPIIFLTAISTDEFYIQKGYHAGAVDYLSKPFNPDILLSKVNIFLQLWVQSNELKLLTEQYKSLLDEVTIQRDMLKELSIKDHLTDVYQRRAFDSFLIKEYATSVRHKQAMSIAMLDLDHFKEINDKYGHSKGDEVLIAAARTIEKELRESDILCRYGGEEFVLLMPNTHLEDAHRCCERIRLGIENLSLNVDESTVHITISIGISTLTPPDTISAEALLELADKHLYQAKENGRNQVYCGPLDQNQSINDANSI